MLNAAKLFSTVTKDAFIRTVAFVPPNLILARLASTQDYVGQLFFLTAAVITQVTAAKVCFLLLQRRKELITLNRVIVVVSALSTSILSWHYLTGGNESLLQLSGLPARCACIILSGVYMTLLSNVRVAELQQHILRLRCRQLLGVARGERYYFAAIVMGTALSGLVYISVGYVLPVFQLPFCHLLNMLIGALLLMVTFKRVLRLVFRLRTTRKVIAIHSPEC
ncbi:hypothetical protein [Arachidicoccus sp.]|uniref:hypothetical protein n=1 Tax=Arachidicoccus sp. TaxID=1872624 RepID=UPI003D19F45F